MKHGRSSMFVKTAGAAVLAGMLAAPAMAQDAAAGPNTGKVSLSAGADVVTNYVFRGVVSENESLIVQPYAYVGFNLYQGDDVVNSVNLTFGIWNSFHENARPTWAEADLSVGIDVTLFDKVTAGMSYIWYQYPGSTSAATQEIDLKISFDDSGMLPDVNGQPLTIAPYVLLAIETSGPGLDGDTDNGIYLEAGIAPSFTIDAVQDYPITFTMPVAVGLSLDNYYEVAAVTGTRDFTFGYVMAGLKASVPLTFIPADYGTWSATAGVLVYFTGTSVDLINAAGTSNGDGVEYVGTFGISMSY